MATDSDSGKWNGVPASKFERGELVDFPVVMGQPKLDTVSVPQLVSEHSTMYDSDDDLDNNTAAVAEKRTSQKEQLHSIVNCYGFIPASNEELSTAWSVHGFKERHIGAAGFLNRVLLHQQKSTSNDPSRALFKKVEEVEKYIKSSKTTLVVLEDILDRLYQVYDKDDLHLFVGNISSESLSTVGLKTIVRRQKVARLFAGEETKKLRLDDISSGEVRRQLEGMGFDELRERIVYSGVQTGNRLDFWTDSLKDFEKHSIVTRKVHEIAQGLGIDLSL